MTNTLRDAIRLVNRKVLLCGSAATLAMLATGVQAQDEIEEVMVEGVRAAQESAINAKRNAASVVDGIAAEDIGKLPDVTVSDSLQRIPGIQVERTAGEGGPVQIRGLSNVATMLNGESFLSATTIDTSGADFGDLPSQLMSGADVYKSARADLASLAIAGTIDLKTRRPFDLDSGWTFAGGAEVDQGSISKEADPMINGLIGWNNETIGFVLSAVTAEKNLATDYNGYFDTSENGGIGATNSNHSWSTPKQDADVYHVVPQGFAAFHKEEERQ
ncbi:MAG TPA: TonB-dependent receptor plug domain-containing protein, partial [Cellvibrio sp.]|nr:TonB-dependent receptor plug domain-containing protein [Cellvibrio sp.]